MAFDQHTHSRQGRSENFAYIGNVDGMATLDHDARVAGRRAGAEIIDAGEVNIELEKLCHHGAGSCAASVAISFIGAVARAALEITELVEHVARRTSGKHRHDTAPLEPGAVARHAARGARAVAFGEPFRMTMAEFSAGASSVRIYSADALSAGACVAARDTPGKNRITGRIS
jgi:hypothetical protein